MQNESKGFLLGTALSVGYFRISESGQPKDSNCSYLAPVSTDIGAVLAAIVLYARSKKTHDFWIGAVSGAILGIHAQQFLHFKKRK